MKKKVIILALSLTMMFLLPLLAIPATTAASETGWLDVLPLGSGTASYQDVAGGGGQYVYATQTGSNSHAFLIISLANPSNPTVVSYLARLDAGHTIGSIEINEDETVAVVCAGLGIYVIDISDKLNPNITKYYNLGKHPEDVDVYGNYAYLASGSDGIPVVDISDIYNPSTHYNGDYGDTASLWARGIVYDPARNCLYVSMSSGYFRTFTVSSGTPSIAGTIPTSGSTTNGIGQIGQYKVATIDDYGLVHIIDTTSLSTPVVQGTVDVGGASGYLGDIAWNTTMGTKFIALEDDSMKAVSFSNPSSPSAGESSGGFSGYGCCINGDYVVVAGGPWGFFVFSLSAAMGGAGFDIPGFTFLYILSTLMTLGLLIVFTRKDKIF